MATRYAAKRLATVEVKPTKSNQHEFNAGLLRKALGIDADRVSGPFTLLFFADDSGRAVVDESEFTLYNAREKKQSLRSPEFRLYYTSLIVERYARPGDLFVAFRPGRGTRLVGIVARPGTPAERELLDALQLGDERALRRFVEASAAPPTPRTAVALGLSLPGVGPVSDVEAHPVFREAVRKREIPGTKVLAEAGLALAEERHGAMGDPDDFLNFATEAETDLYMAIEEAVHGEPLRKLAAGPTASLAEIMAATLSIQQSRKSRRGQSLQNHFAALLHREGIPFTAQCLTERNEKPDFVIPGYDEYHDDGFASDRLRMVACKSRIRDRWRQVLTEAERIPEKYLLTLDDELDADTLDKMRDRRLEVFVPRSVHSTAYARIPKKLSVVRDLVSRLHEAIE